MNQFSRTARIFLGDAEEDLKRGRYASCVIHAHLAIEHTLKHLLTTRGRNVEFLSYLRCVEEIVRLELIDKGVNLRSSIRE